MNNIGVPGLGIKKGRIGPSRLQGGIGSVRTNMRILTTLDLDIVTANGCSIPGCTHMHDPEMYIHSKCHVEADMQCRYDSRDKILHLECGICSAPVADIKVAEP